MSEKLAEMIDAACGRIPCDLVIRNARILDMTSGEFYTGDIGIKAGMIVGTGTGYHGEREIDASGLTAVPGFIDSHVHIESTMVTPYEYERAVLPHGVTTIVCDPHELANVAGTGAIDYFMACAGHTVMDIKVQMSSCVPATHLETSGANISSDDLRKYSGDQSLWLAELMNYPGVLFKDPEVLKKISLFPGRIDGHAPCLGGESLNAYIAAGAWNCHESSSLEEGREKLRKGMNLFIREGSVARNLETLAPLLTVATSPFISFCTDDRNLPDIQRHGHLDHMIATAIASGAEPLAAYRAASWSGALHHNFADRGLIAPGRKADIVLVSDFERCKVEKVVKDGRLVDEALFASRPTPPSAAQFFHSVKRAKVTADSFLPASGKTATPVIKVADFSLLTELVTMELPVRDGVKSALPERDVIKAAVLERHGKNGNIGLGFVTGFGIKRGAIASSVGHDSHNLCVCGASESDMAIAVNTLIEMGGGLVTVIDGEVKGAIALPIGGLISDQPGETVIRQLDVVHESAHETGSPLHDPFMLLAFVQLPVIPAIRLTDRGVVDVAKFDFTTV